MAMAKAARALSGIRTEHDTQEAAVVAALTALEGICEPDGRGIVISAGAALSLFQETEGLGWVDSGEKARGLPRRFGFRSAIHRRERFWTKEQLDPEKETARGYEINLGTLRNLLSRYSTNADPSLPSHSNGQNGFMQVCDAPK